MPATTTANPDCHACHGTGTDTAFGSKCTECDRPNGGARRTIDQRTIRTTNDDRFHRPGERMDGRTFGRQGNGDAPATEAQIALLERLVAERIPHANELDDIAKSFCRIALHTLRALRNGTRYNRRALSVIIDEVMQVRVPRTAQPAPTRTTTTTTLPDVPSGHYAIPSTGDNDLAFYRVDRPTEGQHAGRVFVKMIVGGHPDMNVRRDAIAGILARIAADPEAGPRYGQTIGRCCRCNRTLTDETSRAAGIGPDCAGRA
jgi:hypothetical protein